MDDAHREAHVDGRGGAGRLKAALVGDPDARFVYIGNFEVEHQWSVGEVGLPRTSSSSSSALVNRMDELALLLAGGRDYVVLKAHPDEGYLEYLRSLGLDLPAVIAPSTSDPERTVTEDALASPEVLRALSEVAEGGAYLLPHGVSVVEEDLARRAGLRLATSPAAVCKSVNSKVYSRRVAAEMGLRQPAGWACESLDDLDEALAAAAGLLAQGRRVGVKDAFGVSGKGILVVEDQRRLDQLKRMVVAMARRRDSDRVGLVVEEWVAKSGDLSYQFTVGHDGAVQFDHVGEAIVARGAHQGNRLPARLTPAQDGEVRACAEAIGGRLAKDGYHGVVGVDAMVDPDGGLYPVTEINARNTMLTYLAALSDRLIGAGMARMARQYPLRLGAPLSFDQLRQSLDDLLLREGGSGLVLNTFATVNADPSTGRLYGLVAAPTSERLEAIDVEVAARLAALGEGAIDGS